MDNPCKYCDKVIEDYLDDCEYGCDNPCEKAKEFYSCVGEKLDELLKAVKQFDLHTTKIFLGHPDDLLKMDMKQIACDCCFISNFNVKQGELLMIKEGKLKEELYDFIRINPDRVFRGEKDFKE